jgi:hypothetical protein
MPDIVFNPSLERERADALPSSRIGILEGWTCKASGVEGDLNLFWFGRPTYEVVGVGILRGEVDVQDNSDSRFDWTDAEMVFFGDFEPMVVLDEPIGIEELRTDPLLSTWWATKPYRGQPKTMLKHPIAVRRLLEIIGKKNPYSKAIIRPYLAEVTAAGGGGTSPRRGVGAELSTEIAKAAAQLDVKDRQRVLTEIRRVVREQRLRRRVIQLWGPGCAACGLLLRRNSFYECEVAHVKPVADKGPDHPLNALPLCRTHHWAFDNFLWAIKPDFTMVVSKEVGTNALESDAYDALFRELHGKSLRRGLGNKHAKHLLAPAFVEHRWKAFRHRVRK